MTEIVVTAQLGALVRERRESLKMSMDELANQAKVSRSTVHRLEHAQPVRPMPAKLARLLAAVGIGADEAREALAGDPEYAEEVLLWLSRSTAVEQLSQTLQARPHMAQLAPRPDLVVIDQQTGDVAQVQAPQDFAERLAAILEGAGLLVTQPR